MNITESIINTVQSTRSRITKLPIPGTTYPNQTSSVGDNLMDTLNEFTGMRFQNLGDFFSYYRNSFFKTAYNNLGMNPFGCFQLAMSNPWVGGAIAAISKPIGSSDIIGVPTDDEAKPNDIYIEYLENLMRYPNPTPNSKYFMEQIVSDRKVAGMAYIEVNYNAAGYPARFDRINPAQIEIKKRGDGAVYVKDNGYVFPPESLIVDMEPNFMDNHRGLSPLVKLFNHLMLDESMTEHNLRFFTKDMLKGIINLDPTVHSNHKSAVDEAKRLTQSIKEMEQKGESGHLLVYGATYTAMTNNNRDMLTPTISENIIQAVKTVYRVPPQKIMQIESGNLGGGTGESQEDTMNETLIDEMMFTLRSFNDFFSNVIGITDTELGYDNLTNTDLERQSELDTQSLLNGSTDIDSVRQARGDEPYNEEWSKYPLINKNFVPANMLESIESAPLGSVQASTVPGTEVSADQEELIKTTIQQRVRDLILN